MNRTSLAAAVIFASLALGGCGLAQGPRVRFVSATEAELNAAEKERLVWYEFRQGDAVPLATVFTGVVEGGAPLKAVAKRTFWLVIEKGRPPRFSFDGEHIVETGAGSAGIGLGRDSGVNHVALLVYVGKPEDAPPELKAQ